MALDFPAPPWTNGQVYGNYVYSTSTGAWLSKPLTGPKSTYGPTPPANPGAGDEWVNSNDMTAYGWYVDTDGGQWVEKTAPISANGYYSPNYIINGAFEINQRNFTSSTAGVYGFDRWLSSANTGTVTYSAQTFTPGSGPSGYESANYARIVTTGQSGVDAIASLNQGIEDVRTLAGQTVTLSFWAKAASGAPKMAGFFQQYFGSGGTPSASVNIPAGNVTLSTSWQRYSLTVNIPSISGKTIGTTINNGLYLQFWVSGGTNFDSRTGGIGIQSNTFDIWGVQLESGSIATPFRRNANSIQGELAACQRYYVRFSAVQTYSQFFTLIAQNSGGCQGAVPLPVSMRTAPSAVDYSNIAMVRPGVAQYGITSVTMQESGRDSAGISVVSSTSAAQGDALLLRDNGSNGYIGFSSEL